MTMRDQRDKSAREIAIEQEWRDRLISSASSEDFERAYDELHSLFLEEQQEGSEIYAHVNPRGQDRARQAIVRKVGTGHSILEVGCGDGTTSRLLAEQGNRVRSIDVSEVALRAAKQHLAGHSLDLQYEHGDGRKLEFADNSFDYVVSEHLVEHLSLDDMRTHLSEVRRVLKPGGCYLISTPSRLWNGRRSVGFHLNVYTLGELRDIVQEAGFQAVWIETRFLRRFGRLLESGSWLLRAACQWERLLSATRVYRWPQSFRARVLPTVMVCAVKPAA